MQISGGKLTKVIPEETAECMLVQAHSYFQDRIARQLIYQHHAALQKPVAGQFRGVPEYHEMKCVL